MVFVQLRNPKAEGALTDILVREFMGQSHTLWLMLNGLSIHNCRFELFNDAAVDSVTLSNIQSVWGQFST